MKMRPYEQAKGTEFVFDGGGAFMNSFFTCHPVQHSFQRFFS